jgi:AraC-like DNA-binding protein/quercetin dioxygenase-like cupin family protein
MKSVVSPKSGPPEFFSPQVTEARRFYLNLNPPPRTKLAVVCGGREQCASDYVIHRSTFPYYSIELVAQGRGHLKLQHQERALTPGTAFCYGPGVAQEIHADPAKPLLKYFVDFAGTDALLLLRRAGFAPGAIRQVVAPGEVRSILDELIRTGVRGSRHSAQICNRLLECLLLRLAELSAPIEEVESAAFRTYQRCRAHIQQDFERLRTLGQIADACHVNAAYLCRLFRRFDHQSPYQFLLRLKMHLAAEWLHDPDALIKQVSERSGFSDPFHFSRAFKSVFGLSPQAFRKLR